MPFRFTLKALLRLRETSERTELDKLRAIAAQIIRAKAEIELLDDDSDAERRKMLDEAAKGITGAELHLEVLREEAYRARRSALVKEVKELEIARIERQKRYTEARQQREILSNLRERQLTAYNLILARREQQQLDELFLIRRGNSKNL